MTTEKNKKLSLIESWRLNGIPLLKMMTVYMLILFIMEALFRKSVGDTVKWIVESPFLFSLNLFTLMAISGILLILTKRIVWVTIIVSFLTVILSFINIGKFALRNVPLLYDDIFLLKEVLILLPEIFNLKTILMIGFGVLVAIGLGFALFKFFKKSTLQKHRLAAITLSLISIGVLSIGQNINAADIDISKTGFIYSLSNNTREQVILNEEQLETAGNLYDQYVAEYNSRTHEKTLEKQPNVIVIQSEAFWDINKLGVKFNKNPIPNFEALRKESRYGELYVPVVGGGTSNTEYEILTGMTLKNYSNDWYMVYPNEINKPMVSLASIFKNQGYTTTGIHPYQSWYYNRTAVYEHLGFDTFKTIEYMNDPEIIGAYMSDRYTTDLIIDAIETTETPLFNFTVTMQNHGPYGNHRFSSDQFDIDIKTKLTDSTRYFLANYVQGLYMADIQLERLVNYLRESEEPTILVFYGDHLPMLGEDYQTYREVDYVGDEDNYLLQNDLRMMAVPYLIWSNFDDTSEELPTMNASFITSLILEEAQVEMPDYLKVLAIAREKMPLYFREFGYDSNGTKVEKDSPQFMNIKSLYVSIFDKLKDTDSLKPWLVENNTAYNKTITVIDIESATTDGGSTTLKGNNFYQAMKLTVGESEVAYRFVSENEIVVESALASGDTVMAKLYDSEGKQIAESNAYVLP
jgi:phosphoglycerol transferase MdoB-like AlkP superfamily enzyme